MASRNRICYLCGQPYKYCSNCSQDRYKPAIMNAYCGQDCADIFDICTRYNLGFLTKKQARELLETKDLSRRDSFKECIKKDLNNIFAEDEVIADAEIKVESENTYEEKEITIPKNKKKFMK